MCTQTETMECPDGSFVGRVPERDCNFETCSLCQTVRCAAPPEGCELNQHGAACCAFEC